MSDMVVIEGVVVHGAKLGRRMGFPTANIEIGDAKVENGVYLSSVCIDGEELKAMSNVGVRPSVDGKSRLLEAHIFDYNGDLYGRSLTVRLLRKIRDEKRFDSVDDLQRQLKSDYELIRSL